MSDATIYSVMATVPGAMIHAAAKDTSRYAIKDLHIRKVYEKTAIVAATDGRMLAVREVEAVMTVPHATVPSEILAKGHENRVSLNGRWTASKLSGPHRVNGPELGAATVEGSFPPYEAVMPDPAEHPVVFSLNAELLARLAKAISTDGVVTIGLRPMEKLESGEYKAFPLIVQGDSGAGVLMPVVPNDTEFYRYGQLRAWANGEAKPEDDPRPPERPEAEPEPAKAEAAADPKPEPKPAKKAAKPAPKAAHAAAPIKIDQSKLRDALAALGAA